MVPITSEEEFSKSIENALLLADAKRELELAKSPDLLADDLIVACQNGDVSKVKSLLEVGVNPNAVRTFGTPLTCAMYSPNVLEISHLLIDASADPNLQDQNGWSPLFCAAANDRAEVIRFLAESGADINSQGSSDNRTALMNAAYFGHVNCVKTLLDLGADPEIKTTAGYRAIDFIKKKSLSAKK